MHTGEHSVFFFTGSILYVLSKAFDCHILSVNYFWGTIFQIYVISFCLLYFISNL